jgi:hypothetical protein
MSALTSEGERAVQRLVPLVASVSLERDERVRAARALSAVLEGGDPAAAHRLAEEVERRRAQAARTAGGGAPARGGRLRRGLRTAGEVLDFLNPF